MTVTAPPLDVAGAALDQQIAAVQALVDAVATVISGTGVTADSATITADNFNITADAAVSMITTLAANPAVLYQYVQLLNQLQVEAVDHYMVTGWLNAGAVLAQYTPPVAWDEPSQELSARVAYLTQLVANPPPMPAGNTDGYGGSGWTTILQNYQQALYAAQISLVEHMMDVPGGTTAATILAGMSGAQSFPFQYVSSSTLPGLPVLPPLTPVTPPAPPPSTSHTIGGDVSGMNPGGQIVLQLNGANDLTIQSNGAFIFAEELSVGNSYSVTVKTPPVGQAATVVNGSGVVPGLDVNNIEILLAASTLHFVGGTMSGFSGSIPVVLQNNGGDTISLSSNGAFQFPTPIANGQSYNVTVKSKPAGLIVVVTGGSGTVAGNDITSVSVSVGAPATYFVGGTLTDLPAGKFVVLRNNGGDDLTLNTNGTFAFATKVSAGHAYNVTVLTPPSGDTCTVTNGSGTVGNQDVTDVGVDCILPPSLTVGGTASGLTAGQSFVLQNNGGDNLTVNANGSFTFATPLSAGQAYNVTVLTPPAGDTCTITNGSGTMPAHNIANVTAVCAPIAVPSRRYATGIAVALSYAQSGLGPNGDVLSADTGNYPAYAGGTAAVPLTIPSGPYSNGTIPGGHLGTGTSTGCSQGTGAGGHTLSRSGSPTTGPAVNIDATHRVVAVVMRYPWRDVEPTQNNYVFTRMDADLAQCIALGILWYPMMVFHTFGAAEVSGPGTQSNPDYMANYTGPGSGGTALLRWDNVHVVPRTTALFTAIGQRYDLCPNFGGIATQETTTSGMDSVPWAKSTGYSVSQLVTNSGNYYICTHAGTSSGAGTGPSGTGSGISDGSVTWNYLTVGYSQNNYLTALNAESDAISTASPNSRHLAFQNFIGGATGTGDPIVDQYAAHLQQNGAILCGPDLVCCGGAVYTRCYTSGSGAQAGRYSGYRNGGTIGSGVKFNGTGMVALSIQRAEWIGIGPACTTGQTIARALSYFQGSSSSAIGTQPNFLSKPGMLIMDWHQGTAGESGTLQQFTPDAINLITANATSTFFGP